MAALRPGGLADAAEAIRTTDTCSKTARRPADLGRGRRAVVAGMAKGSGMIHPDMATMLAVVVTDAPVSPAGLRTLLREGCARSFHRITVDGDQSTNDTVLALASGAVAGRPIGPGRPGWAGLRAALQAVLEQLAIQIARDGEGATRLVEVVVRGARTEADAATLARAIARSPLVKTAVHGGDPNWGRILSAAGSCGVAFDPGRATVRIGRTALYRQGSVAGARARAGAERAMTRDPVRIGLELAGGRAEATAWTCDLSAEYIRINADYTT